MFEKIIPAEKFDRIPMEIRNDLQRTLIKMMLDEKIVISQMDWIDKYRETVSLIIDNTDNAEIRELAIAKQYEQAARLIKDRLLLGV